MSGTPVSSRARFSRRDVAVATVLAVILGVVIAAPLVTPSSSAYGRESAVPVIAGLGAPAAAEDALPAGFPAGAHGDGGIDRSSARLVGTFNGDRYWIARDAKGQVCLLAQTIRVPEQTVGSCAAPSALETGGIALEISGRWNLAAFLVPDSIDTSAAGPSLVALSPNLLVADPSVPPGLSVKLPRDPGASGPQIAIVETLQG